MVKQVAENSNSRGEVEGKVLRSIKSVRFEHPSRLTALTTRPNHQKRVADPTKVIEGGGYCGYETTGPGAHEGTKHRLQPFALATSRGERCFWTRCCFPNACKSPDICLTYAKVIQIGRMRALM